jgi:hypothetical protein
MMTVIMGEVFKDPMSTWQGCGWYRVRTVVAVVTREMPRAKASMRPLNPQLYKKYAQAVCLRSINSNNGFYL